MKDNNEDMKKLINAWESSKKFKSLQIELDKLKKQYADFTTLSNQDINKYLERIEISKEKLQGIIDDEKNIEFENDDFNFLEKLQAYKKLNKEQEIITAKSNHTCAKKLHKPQYLQFQYPNFSFSFHNLSNIK